MICYRSQCSWGKNNPVAQRKNNYFCAEIRKQFKLWFLIEDSVKHNKNPEDIFFFTINNGKFE